MRRESFQGILLGIVIMCAVFAFITIAWAAFSSTLTIGGQAQIKKTSWKVEFTSDYTGSAWTASESLTGASNASTNSTNASLTNANFAVTDALTVGGSGGDMLGELQQEGDKITYTFYVRNYGDFDSTVALSSGLISSGTNANDVSLTCKGLTQGSSPLISDSDAQTWCNAHIRAQLFAGPVGSSSGSTVGTNMVQVTSGFKYNLKAATPSDNLDVIEVKLVIEFIDDGDSSTNYTNNNADVIVASINNGSGITLNATQGTTAYGG